MNSRNKLAEMPIRPLLYTMAVPLMLSLLVQSLYNIVDSIFVARLSETALTAASLVYSIQFLMNCRRCRNCSRSECSAFQKNWGT